jgi:cytoskeletal protein RodZ
MEEKEEKTSPEKPNEEKLDLGFKDIRESKGMTLKEVSCVTKIGESILENIENEEFDLLPEPFYAKAFIRAYAEALDVDGKEVLVLYNKYLEESKTFDPKDDVVKEKFRPYGNNSFLILLLAATVIFIVFISIFLYQYGK